MTLADVTTTQQRSFKTLSRRDADFTKYLDGSFSSALVALPIRSLNVGTASEQVTFEILEANAVETPSLAKVFAVLVRPTSLIFSAGPMLVELARIASGARAINWLVAIASFIGVLAFQMATNLFNDYGDHMKGQDRLRPQGGSRAIQKGWVRARTVKTAALGLTGFAALCGVPAIVHEPVLIVAGLAFLFTLEFAFQRLRLKARGWAEGIAFLLTGPLLTAGYAYAVTGRAEIADASLGCIFGAIALLYFHSANFENIMVDSQAGARTWATRAGFDASKTFFLAVAVACVAISLVHIVGVEQNPRLISATLAEACLLFVASRRVSRLKSPLSSELQGLRNSAIQIGWLTTLVMIPNYIWTSAA
jgi:1,4-dihydroxy-2-naphthoate octaprenyltransferase